MNKRNKRRNDRQSIKHTNNHSHKHTSRSIGRLISTTLEVSNYTVSVFTISRLAVATSARYSQL